jgi:hypothetical protein
MPATSASDLLRYRSEDGTPATQLNDCLHDLTPFVHVDLEVRQQLFDRGKDVVIFTIPQVPLVTGAELQQEATGRRHGSIVLHRVAPLLGKTIEATCRLAQTVWRNTVQMTIARRKAFAESRLWFYHAILRVKTPLLQCSK